MANTNFIKNRIAGKEKELEKLNTKLARIQKAQATNWSVNPYYYDEYDLRSTTRAIEEAKQALAKYQEQLASEIEKENSRNVPAIVEFLNNWKERMAQVYTKGLNEYWEEKKALKELYRAIPYPCYTECPEKTAYNEAAKVFRQKCRGYYKEVEFTTKSGKISTYETKVCDGEYEWLHRFTQTESLQESLSKLEKELTQEWNRKYDFIIVRTNKIVGQITDASNLRVGAKGDLNGYILGTKGKAKVQTIGAGGYNIQCFHFRTLINEL